MSIACRFARVTCVIAVAACTSPTQSAQPSAPVLPPKATTFSAAHEDVGAPLQVRVYGPPTVVAGQTIELRATIDRHLLAAAPLALSLQVPPGTRLVSGPSSEVLLDTTSHRFDRAWLLHVDAIPPQDAIVVVDWQTPAGGYHAEIAYRFGRPEPKLDQPLATGPEIILPNGVSLGRPIQMGPDTVKRTK